MAVCHIHLLYCPFDSNSHATAKRTPTADQSKNLLQILHATRHGQAHPLGSSLFINNMHSCHELNLRNQTFGPILIIHQWTNHLQAYGLQNSQTYSEQKRPAKPACDAEPRITCITTVIIRHYSAQGLLIGSSFTE